MVRLTWGALSCCIALWLLAGCRGVASPWQGLPPPPELLSHAEPIWQHLAMRRRTLLDLKGLAQVQVRVAAQSVALDEVVVVVQPGEGLRFEGLGPLGQPLFLFIAHHQHLALYAPQEGRLISGAASAENTKRLLGLALAPIALQYLLLGDLPLVTLPTTGRLVYRARDNLYRWDGVDSQQETSYRAWFEPYHLHPVRFEMTDALGQLVLLVRYEAFQWLDNFLLPYRIIVEQPVAGRRAVWQYAEVQLNTGVRPALFRLQVPAGTEQIELEHMVDHTTPVLLRSW